MPHPLQIDRRQLLLGSGAALSCGVWTRTAASAVPDPFARFVVSIADLGARADAADNTAPIQAAIREAERRGGGTVVIPGRFKCGNITILGSGVRLQGQNGWLVDARLTIGPAATNIQLIGVGIIETRGDRRNYLLDVSGQDCRFDNVQLIKDPITGGVQMYIRKTAARCHFNGLRLKGSNGIILSGRDHLFENFELQSTLSKSAGGDDAFAIKAANSITENITIRNGTIRGYGAMISFGSELGTSKDGSAPGAVRNVTVENVTGDRCTRIAFFKPGALDYDYRNGVVEHIVFKNVTLSDPAGDYFRTGIYILAGRGAIIRDVQADGIKINARALDRGVAPTSAVQIYLMDKDAPPTIKDITLQIAFTDPHEGAAHSASNPGYPVDYVVQVEKQHPTIGSISGIVFDLEGRGAGSGGIYVGPGLDGAVTVRRAILTKVAASPVATAGTAGIWSSSRIQLGDVRIDSGKHPKLAGRAFQKQR